MSPAQQYQFNREFLEAIVRNDLTRAFELHEQGADLDAKDGKGWTSLMRASNKGLGDVALALIEKGADLDAQDNKGKTALVWAYDEFQIDLALMLIGKGADLEIKDHEGVNVLMLSSLYGCTDHVFSLIAHGANSMTLKENDDFYGLTHVQACAAGGLLPKLQALLDDPAPRHLACEQPQALMELALKYRQPEAVGIIQSDLAMKAINGLLAMPKNYPDQLTK